MLSGKFSTSDLPEKYHDIILITAHLHRFKKDRLSPSLHKSLSNSEKRQLSDVKKFFIEKIKAEKNKAKVRKEITKNKLTLFGKDLSPSVIVHLDSALEQITLPEDLMLIKQKAELCLGMRPTVGEFLAKNVDSFYNLSKEEVLALQLFYKRGLKEDAPKKKIKITEDFYDQSINTSIILNAPPGCGKTHSIVHRLDFHLSQLDQYFDARKILILSFTRNAVKELRGRINSIANNSKQKNLDLVKVHSFDSFAYQVLLNQEDNAPKDDFEENIVKVKAILLDNYLGGNTILDEIQWIYIDEYQDLVGCRADLVLELTKFILKKNGSVSLLGDPCQQIMNFQIGHRNETTNTLFISTFRQLVSSNSKTIELFKSYRFKTEQQCELVNSLREEILQNKEVIIGTRFAPVIPLTSVNKGGAILCIRNVDCLLIKLELERLGQHCSINYGCERIPAPSWIYTIFAFWKQRSMSKSSFLSKCYQKLNSDSEVEIEYLKKLGVYSKDLIQVDLLVCVLEERGGVECNINHPSITVSTVHKAKGLQYPHVAYFSKRREYEAGSDALNEFYVAATRAEKSFSYVYSNEIPKVWRNSTESPYVFENSCFLEGIKEIELSSFFHGITNISEYDLRACMSKTINFELSSEYKKVYVVAALSERTKIKMYRMPRLERISEIRDGLANNRKLIPKSFSTFVYTGTSKNLEELLGPTCLINMPIFEGLWEFRNEK